MSLNADYIFWGIVALFILYLLFRKWQDSKLFKNIGPAQLKEMMDKGEKPVVVDVRESWEYKGGHIPGARTSPLSTFQSQYDKLDKERTIVVVCQSGNRSKTASRFLAKAGYKKLYHLAGGTSGWANQGYPIEK